ncbi:MAG TPA: UDP-glucose--hexose-1-phosphate uridylyltransferase [Candidatus Acidoferrales bacterium]|jgi:UDPglucose--hexose-1-phosphate uridylyltransferase|nr:UDP-glucose--hexose-1-phosphate uridylyltransferase [Candidatus Acidoferrales bacterium]
MGQFELDAHPHRRLNPLTREWVLVSPHRTQRPWQGQIEPTPSETSVAYDPQCYLCPGNARAGGAKNPDYKSTFLFDNDFAALRPDTPAGGFQEEDLLRAQSEAGQCRVICYSPRHDLTLARMSVDEINVVVNAWSEEFARLASLESVRSVQIFENRGAMMGCSNPHPHGQIWANETVPDELAREVATQREYLLGHNATLLADYLELELRKRERVVCANEHFAALVPFWAVWPYETLLISRRAVSSLPELNDAEREGLAQILRLLTIRYDNLFKTSFPYTMGFHQRPIDDASYPGFHLHAHFYPPLLRSAAIKKFMVGFELLAMPQRDITAESAAKQLRELPDVHYLDAL